MFGENLARESPWDSPAGLVPESDEGNVEYKRQLLNPSPDRFVRLVTQLKWRLLEGRGRALYELGVADSGMLVGLPRQQLEQSLDTLDMMAAEIGASVIVVKEINVPTELARDVKASLGDTIDVSLDISSVYKPRPMKRRATDIASLSQPSHVREQHSGEIHHQQESKLGTHPPELKRPDTVSPGEPNVSAVDDSFQVTVIDPQPGDTPGTTILSNEPRLIVEALVVGNPSLDETYLDFQGFSLQ